MNEWIIITLVLAGIMLVLGVIVIFVMQKKSKRKKETDYRALYSIGFVFIPAGIALMIATKNPGLLGITALGIVYMSIGLANKDKWKKK